MSLVKQQVNNVFDTLKDAFGYKSKLQAPRLEKVVINVGTGKRAKTDKNWNEFVADRLAKITGQKAATRGAKQSIAGFKVREGDAVGQIVTLRGQRMYSFLDKLVHIALPRTKDFRGLNRSSVDAMGNMTLGIKEHTIFPETSDEELKDIFGLSISVTTTAKNKEEATKLFEHLGFPLKKEDDK
jgi:large subunit ribosomal protein L5